MSPYSIEMRGVSKRYVKYDDQPMLATQIMRLRSRSKRSQLWALKDVDLLAEPGECVGVIGRNGAGKTTMLQLLAGVTAPTRGSVAVRGRIAPLIAVGVGFHPELSGRENVYVNGSILGLSRGEIDRRFDSIVDFSEIGEFIDTPVKFYSSGMAVRLGFSVAIQAEPDVLLVDEVLAVGDLAFQWKCFDRMMEIRRSGTTIAVVSHNLHAVRKLCDRTLLVNQGEVIFEGDTTEAISQFHMVLGEHRDIDGEEAVTSTTATIEEVAALDTEGRSTAYFDAGDTVVLRAHVRFDAEVEDPTLHLGIRSDGGAPLYSEHSQEHLSPGRFAAGDRCTFEVRLPAMLSTGSYSALLSLVQPGGAVIDGPRQATFYVAGRVGVRGADLGAQFTLDRTTLDAESTA